LRQAREVLDDLSQRSGRLLLVGPIIRHQLGAGGEPPFAAAGFVTPRAGATGSQGRASAVAMEGTGRLAT
jgi:hypothetical protein